VLLAHTCTQTHKHKEEENYKGMRGREHEGIMVARTVAVALVNYGCGGMSLGSRMGRFGQGCRRGGLGWGACGGGGGGMW
jgi:hypothetical protein